MGRYSSKVVYQKRDLKKNWKQLLVTDKKSYCQLYIDYELNKYILKIFKKIEVLVITVFSPSQAKGTLLYP